MKEMSREELLKQTTSISHDGSYHNAKALVVQDDGTQKWQEISPEMAKFICTNGKRLQ